MKRCPSSLRRRPRAAAVLPKCHALTLVLCISLSGCAKIKQLFLPDLATDKPVTYVDPAASLAAPTPSGPTQVSPIPQTVTLADGRVVSGEYAEATELQQGGQFWLARLKLETRALGSSGTKDERMLLRAICTSQQDAACVERCAALIGEAGPAAISDKKLAEMATKNPAAALAELSKRAASAPLSKSEEAMFDRLCKGRKDPHCPQSAVVDVPPKKK